MRDAPTREEAVTAVPLLDPEQREQRRARQRRRWQHVLTELSRGRDALARVRPEPPVERTG